MRSSSGRVDVVAARVVVVLLFVKNELTLVDHENEPYLHHTTNTPSHHMPPLHQVMVLTHGLTLVSL